MPTYEYQCTQCNYLFEEFQKISDQPKTVCPQCSGPLKRLPGAGSGIIFKGSGFYCTDYKKTTANTATSKQPASKSASETPASETQKTAAANTKKDTNATTPSSTDKK